MRTVLRLPNSGGQITKPGKYLLLLGLAQALHSMEEIYFHLYDFSVKADMALPAIISSIAQLEMRAEIFAIMNIVIIAAILAVVPFYEKKRHWAVSAAWIAACAEVLNGFYHLTAAMLFARWFPGALSAPLLLLMGALLLHQLAAERKRT
ncbi:MAG TPA: HXXEE domain-containing protein [bacterium]|nr:HXXEE domain-containing protein [bacterium]